MFNKICSCCGGGNLIFNANAKWCPIESKYVLDSESVDEKNVICSDCDGETGFVLKELNESLLPCTIQISWSYEDVMWQAKQLGIKCSEQQAKQILLLIDMKHDCNHGISWDTISCYLNDLD